MLGLIIRMGIYVDTAAARFAAAARMSRRVVGNIYIHLGGTRAILYCFMN